MTVSTVTVTVSTATHIKVSTDTDVSFGLMASAVATCQRGFSSALPVLCSCNIYIQWCDLVSLDRGFCGSISQSWGCYLNLPSPKSVVPKHIFRRAKARGAELSFCRRRPAEKPTRPAGKASGLRLPAFASRLFDPSVWFCDRRTDRQIDELKVFWAFSRYFKKLKN